MMFDVGAVTARWLYGYRRRWCHGARRWDRCTDRLDAVAGPQLPRHAALYLFW